MRSHNRNKSLSPPKVDERDYSTLVSEIKQLIPFYTPEWQVSRDRDSGSALLKIFAQMVAGTIKQLNQVPEKNFIAFLNLLGMKLLPAQSAKAPVSFSLSEGTRKNVLIPAKTKIAAEKGSVRNESIVFETEKSISVTTAKLVAAYSVNPQRDRIFPAPPGFLTEQQKPVLTRLVKDAQLNDTTLFLEDTSEIETGNIIKVGNDLYYEYLEVEQVSDRPGEAEPHRQVTLRDPLTARYAANTTVVEKVVNFELFKGKNKQEHSLYLGHSTLFNFTDDVRLTLAIEPVDSLTKVADTSLMSWQYWGISSETQTAKWHSFNNVMLESDKLILEKNNDHELQETKINEINCFWIRCTIVAPPWNIDLEPINKLPDIQIDDIKVIVPSSEAEITTSSLDYCLIYNNLQYENKTGVSFKPFPALTDKHQSIYLGFDAPLQGLISLFFSLETETDDCHNRLRLNWSYYQKQKAKREWERLNLRDETNSLTQSGIVELIGSSDFAPSWHFGKSLYWIRIIDIEDQFSSIPELVCKGIYLNTTWAIQAETIEREIVGFSNGKAEQIFTLYRSPVLSEEVWIDELTALTVEDREKLLTLAKQNKLQVEEVRDSLGNTTQFWVQWQAGGDLLESMPSDEPKSPLRNRHYLIDRTLGQIKFGNGREGAIPPKGENNIRVTYRVGGGKQGNVERGEINRLNSSIAYVDRVTNPEPAQGGVDSELLEQALERGSQFLKHGYRAVTASDFERLSEQADRSIAKVKCLPNTNNQGMTEPGWVSIVIVPNTNQAKPQPSLQLKKQVKTYLQQRTTNLVTIPQKIAVRSPIYIEIAIKTKIIAIALETVPEVELITKQLLDAFLHPVTGGKKNQGWEFGRSPCLSDFYALLGSIPNVNYVDSLSIVSLDDQEISVPSYALVSSGKHQIDVTANL